MIPEYLVSFDTGLLPVEEADILIVGSGIAGLRCALALQGTKTVLVSKGGLENTCTYNAQGGIAAALDHGDSPE
ncbi:MAG TPA: FAD-dependent oxidoreductase, partial [bacterium]|nr:FAD-dependent oxidoreductase [bacterium]